MIYIMLGISNEKGNSNVSSREYLGEKDEVVN
jgi:hypothetical protein